MADMSTKATCAKDQMIHLIQEQPDDSSYDELLRELAFARMVDRGLADSDAGRTIDHAEMKRTLETWRK
jgi:predicted transcriptional regulator